jgi:hypothetical protein
MSSHPVILSKWNKFLLYKLESLRAGDCLKAAVLHTMGQQKAGHIQGLLPYGNSEPDTATHAQDSGCTETISSMYTDGSPGSSIVSLHTEVERCTFFSMTVY